MLRQACTSAQSRQVHRYSHTQLSKVDKDSDRRLDL